MSASAPAEGVQGHPQILGMERELEVVTFAERANIELFSGPVWGLRWEGGVRGQ